MFLFLMSVCLSVRDSSIRPSIHVSAHPTVSQFFYQSTTSIHSSIFLCGLTVGKGSREFGKAHKDINKITTETGAKCRSYSLSLLAVTATQRTKSSPSFRHMKYLLMTVLNMNDIQLVICPPVSQNLAYILHTYVDLTFTNCALCLRIPHHQLHS